MGEMDCGGDDDEGCGDGGGCRDDDDDDGCYCYCYYPDDDAWAYYRCTSSFACRACTRRPCCPSQNELYTFCPIDPFRSMRSILTSTSSASSGWRNYHERSNLDTFGRGEFSPVQLTCSRALALRATVFAIVGLIAD